LIKSAVGFGKSREDQKLESFAKREVEGGYGPTYVGQRGSWWQWFWMGASTAQGLLGHSPNEFFLVLLLSKQKKNKKKKNLLE